MTERIDEFSFVFNAVSLESCGSRRASYPDRSNIVPGRAINLRVNRAAFQGGTSVLLMQAGHNGALPVFLWRRRGRLPALPLLPVRARPLRFFLTARRTESPAKPSRVCRRARPMETPRTYPQNAGQRPHLSGGWLSGRSGTQGVLQSRPFVFGLYALPSFPSRGTPRPTSSPFLHKSSCPSISADPEPPTARLPVRAARRSFPAALLTPCQGRLRQYLYSPILPGQFLFWSLPYRSAHPRIPVEQIYKQEYT